MHSTTTTQNVGPRKYSPFDQAEAAAGTMQYTFGAMHIGKNFRICLCWKSMSLLGCPDRFTDSNLRRVSPLGAQLRDGEARYVHFSVATSTWNRAYFPLLFPRRTLLHWPLNYEFWCKILRRRSCCLTFLTLKNHRFLQHGNMAFHSKGFQCAHDKFKIQV